MRYKSNRRVGDFVNRRPSYEAGAGRGPSWPTPLRCGTGRTDSNAVTARDDGSPPDSLVEAPEVIVIEIGDRWYLPFFN